MRIQSKNTGIMHDITRKQWEGMRSRGDHRHYKVIDESDNNFETKEIRVEPIELVPSYIDGGEIEGTNEGINEAVNEDDEKQFYKDFLDEKGVYYHPNTGVKKLKDLYEENL